MTTTCRGLVLTAGLAVAAAPSLAEDSAGPGGGWAYVQVDDARSKWGDFAEPDWLRPKTGHNNGQGYGKGDLDGDGHPEVLLAAADGIYAARIPKDPNGGAWPWVRVVTRGTDEGFAVADVDGDGDADLVGGDGPPGDEEPTLVAWWANPGSLDGTWRRHVVGETAHAVDRVVAVDLDGDGDLDIVGPAWDDYRYLHLWRNRSSGGPLAFRSVTIDEAPPHDPWTKIAADIDGDGRGDLVVAGQKGPLVWYRSPEWERYEIAAGGWSTVGGAAGDVDLDGDLDVVMGGTLWYENPGGRDAPVDDSWTAHRIGDDPTHDVVLGDLDGDGRIDAVTRNQSEFDTRAGDRIRIWLQGPDDGWRGVVLECPHGEGVALGDLDGDGDPDVVTGGIWFETMRGSEGVEWTKHRFTDWHPNATVAVADFSGDGRADVALAPSELAGQEYRLSWFEAPENPRARGWREHVLSEKQEAVVHSLAAADVDLDGRPDVLFAEMHQGRDPDEVGVFLNRGETWVKQLLATTGSHGLQPVDFDGDGDADVFGANWSGPHQPLELWQNLQSER